MAIVYVYEKIDATRPPEEFVVRPVRPEQLMMAEYHEFFDYIFATAESMKDRNKRLMLLINKYLLNKGFLQKLMLEPALVDFHSSLLKSILVMTQNIDGLEEERRRVQQILNGKM